MCCVNVARSIFGVDAGQTPVSISPWQSHVLIAGAPSSGKSLLAACAIEQLVDYGYQVCVIDPEGDHGLTRRVVHLGSSTRVPSHDEIIQVLEWPDFSATIDLLGLPFGQRPSFLRDLYERIMELESRTGRPHWLIVDEAHHLLPAMCADTPLIPLVQVAGTLFITVDLEHLAPKTVQIANIFVALGERAVDLVESFARQRRISVPEGVPAHVPDGHGVVWFLDRNVVSTFVPAPGPATHRRHRRKYAEGDMGSQRSFYFRGPHDRHNLPARNLVAFLDIADDVDDDTWCYHLRRGDYSAWIRGTVGDDTLADAIAEVESHPETPSLESRERIRLEIEARYTLPV